jgi:4-hydroxy-tetrahydrodipicolinate reductase
MRMMVKEGQIIRVAVVGAAGRMGMETACAVTQAEGFELVLAVDRLRVGERLRDVAGGRAADLVIEDKLGAALDRVKPDVLIDFTNHGSAVQNASSALTRGIAPIIGTTGVSSNDVRSLTALSREHETPGMYVPNFAIGAVLMMHFSELAAKWMPDVEIIEMHHDLKQDAPSGTAMLTAEKIAEGRYDAPKAVKTTLLKVEGARGGTYKDVPVHSVRLPGLLAHQTVMFGGTGEVLTLRHDSMNRSSFMPGVVLCAREVWNQQGFVVGMDRLLLG